jgi:hypothetical protein
MDFSEGIQLIRAAHSDAIAILSKWRELIESPGDVTITIKQEGGEPIDITLPSIRAAINRYLGSVFDQMTLSDGTHTVIIRMNNEGAVELVTGAEAPAHLITGTLAVARIEGIDGNLPITGNVGILGGSIQDATIENLISRGGRIGNATFSGTTTISGSTRITGTLTVNKVVTQRLDMGAIQYRKQVVRFGIESAMTNALNSTDGDIWTGDPAVLEAAGIYAEPTWADCNYMPEEIIGVASNIHIYWGTSGNVKVLNQSALEDFWTPLITAWPYKMYEPVSGGYRIRWLPLTGQEGRIHYARVGNCNGTGVAVTRIQSNETSTTHVVRVQSLRMLANYSCGRFMAASETATGSGVTSSTHTMYKL